MKIKLIEKLYSTGYEDLDELLEKAFCDGYEYAQKEFGKKNWLRKSIIGLSIPLLGAGAGYSVCTEGAKNQKDYENFANSYGPDTVGIEYYQDSIPHEQFIKEVKHLHGDFLPSERACRGIDFSNKDKKLFYKKYEMTPDLWRNELKRANEVDKDGNKVRSAKFIVDPKITYKNQLYQRSRNASSKY